MQVIQESLEVQDFNGRQGGGLKNCGMEFTEKKAGDFWESSFSGDRIKEKSEFFGSREN